MILERIPGERFSRVLPQWGSYTAVLIAGGPSLTREHVELVRGAREVDRVRVIGINDAYLIAPWADVIYAADSKWHKWHAAGIDKPKLGMIAAEVRLRWSAYMGQKCSIENSLGGIEDPNVHILRNKYGDSNHGAELSLDSERLAPGRHSGFQALNLAVLAGCKRVLLLGYDAKDSHEGDKHWHGDHPSQSNTSVYALMRQAFSLAERGLKAAGVSVINCSPHSAIDTFPKIDLQDALEMVCT